jgi:hypothetical protein
MQPTHERQRKGQPQGIRHPGEYLDLHNMGSRPTDDRIVDSRLEQI